MAASIASTCGLCGAPVASSLGSLPRNPACISLRNAAVPVRNPNRLSRPVVRAAKEEKEEEKESLFTSITNALDFAAVRSEEDAQLLAEARSTTKNGGKMSREQYGALRRKVGGTAKSYFKEFIDVDGAYVEDGWVDKTCKYCRKDTSRDPRQKDGSGRYAHVACAESAKARGNIFTRMFRR